MVARKGGPSKRNLKAFQTNFSSGELDQKMRMRSDLKSFFSGARSLQNASLLVQGGAKRRPGTRYRSDLGVESVLHEYSFTEGQDYCLAFQNTKLLIFDIDGTLLQTLTSQPWTLAQAKELTLANSADTIIICHNEIPIRKILRTGASTFTSAVYAFEVDSSGAPTKQPYFKFTADSLTMTPSATTGSINLTASSAHFVAGHVGTIFRYSTSADLTTYKEIQIDSITSPTIAACTVLETLAATTAQIFWDEQTFSSVNGYPRAVAFHDQRLLFAGSTKRPDGFWGSQIGGFFNFDIDDATAEDAIDATVAADSVAEIRHLVSSRNIQLFTNGGELFIPTSAGNPLTPGNVQFLTQTPYGTGQKVNPVKFDGATLFLQKTGAVIREFIFSDIEQAHTSNAISPLSNHLIKTVVDSAVLLGTDTQPEQYAYFVNSDGTAAVFHSSRNDELAGWVPWDTPGNSGTDKFLSFTQVGTKMFAATERTVAGATVYWLEEFDPELTLDAASKFDTSTELSTNGTFAADTGWTKGTGWTIAGGVASCDGSQGGDSDLEQANAATNTSTYRVQFTLSSVTAGTVTPRVTDGAGTAESADGTFVQIITASTGANLQFRADSDFIGDVSAVTITEVNLSFTAAHLDSMDVHGVTNTAKHYMEAVTTDGSGVATFTQEVNNAHVGLDYTFDIETNPPDAFQGTGSLMGSKKRIGRIVVSVYETRSLNIEGNELVLTSVNDDFSVVPASNTGDHIFFLTGWSLDPTATLTQTFPLHATIRGIYMEVMA